MTAPISRRGVIAAPILLAGCRKRSEYFGNTAAPARQTPKFALGDAEPFRYAWIDTNWRPQ